jgi:hypothetical protein
MMISGDFDSVIPIVCSQTISQIYFRYSAVMVNFKDNQFVALKRSQLFGKTEFLAHCGGLLGLFLGFSVISVLELVYFFTIRLFCNFKKQGTRKN